MKREYVKPEAEYTSFEVEEELLDIIEGEMGTSELPEGWE